MPSSDSRLAGFCAVRLIVCFSSLILQKAPAASTAGMKRRGRPKKEVRVALIIIGVNIIFN